MDWWNKELIELLKTIDYKNKLAVTLDVLKHVADHYREGGSYRYLIYDRLGFGPDAYAVLMDDGMFLSNNFDIKFKEEVLSLALEHKIEVLKKPLRLCDSDNCFDKASYFNKDLTLCLKHWELHRNEISD